MMDVIWERMEVLPSVLTLILQGHPIVLIHRIAQSPNCQKQQRKLDVLDLDGALQLQNNVPHSVWYNRYKQYSSEMPYMDDYDFVLTDKDLIETECRLV